MTSSMGCAQASLSDLGLRQSDGMAWLAAAASRNKSERSDSPNSTTMVAGVDQAEAEAEMETVPCTEE
jgi:hypothetical protein